MLCIRRIRGIQKKEKKKKTYLYKFQFVSFTEYFNIIGSTPPNGPEVHTHDIHKTKQGNRITGRCSDKNHLGNLSSVGLESSREVYLKE